MKHIINKSDIGLLSEAYKNIVEQGIPTPPAPNPQMSATPTTNPPYTQATATPSMRNIPGNAILTPSITIPSILIKLQKSGATKKLTDGMGKLLDQVIKDAKLTDKETALIRGHFGKFLQSNPLQQ